MNPRAASVAFVILLLVATSALGLAFQGGGLGGSPLLIAQRTTAETGGPATGPRFVLKAELEYQDYGIFANSSLLQLPTLVGTFPIEGARVSLVPLQPEGLQSQVLNARGRPVAFEDVTNGSGLAVIHAPAGNYTVVTAGNLFNFTEVVSLRGNLTTLLALTVYPHSNKVNSMEVINQRTVSQVEPTATIFLNVSGTFVYAPHTPYRLTGLTPDTYGTYSFLTILCNVVSEYSAPGGTWAVMSPIGAYTSFPTGGLFLQQFEANSTVSYSAS
jgi:hypothetical protein